MSESYLDNLITVCNPKKDSEYTNDGGEEYWMTCLVIKGAYQLAAGITALATSTYMLA